MTPEAGSIGSYRIVRKLGEGGMGTVWLGEHTLLGRRAAIKLLLPEFTSSEQIVQRFFNEARAVTAIADPGIVQVFDFGYANGSAYIVMELLEGEPMDARLRRIGRFPPVDAIRLMAQIATSLGAAHAKGVVHRDLKPENIFIVGDPAVTGGERTKILDFGIAKLAATEHDKFKTRTGVVMGTPVFMSPEQCRGAATIDGRSDIYTLGCVLFTMLCGRPPFEGEGTGDLIIMHVRDAPPVPSSIVPGLVPEMDALVARCLEKDPDHRFQSTAELVQGLAAVEAALYGMPVDERFRRSLRMPFVGGESAGSPATEPDSYRPRMTPAAALAYRQQPTPVTHDVHARPGTAPASAPTTLSAATGTIKPPGRRKLGVLVASALALVVTAIAVGAVMAARGKADEASTNTPASPPTETTDLPVATPVMTTPDAATTIETPADAAALAAEPPRDAAEVAVEAPGDAATVEAGLTVAEPSSGTTTRAAGGEKRPKKPPVKRDAGRKQGGPNATTSPKHGTIDRGD